MTSENSLNIFQRICAVMGDLHYIEKGSAKVNGMYRFVSHDQVKAKVHPLLVKYGIVVLPTTEEIKQDNNRTIAQLAVTFVNSDCPTDFFAVRFYGYGVDSGDKGPGKAVSYAYKYALLNVLCLETGDDPDNDANAVYEPAKCLEFDSMIPADFSDKDLSKMKKYLQECADSTNKHVEDIKRYAITKMPEFLNAFKCWNSRKKE